VCAVQCGLRFCSQCLTDWHESRTCDENMMAMHGQIDGLVSFSVFFIVHLSAVMEFVSYKLHHVPKLAAPLTDKLV